MSYPGQDLLELVQSFRFRRGRLAHDDNLDLQRPRRLDLGVGRAPATVLGHQRFDPFALHQCEFVGERERAARQDQPAFGQRVDLRRPVDRPHDVAMLRRSREGGELQPPLREEDCSWGRTESVDSVVHGSDFKPAVAGLARPRSAGEYDERSIGRVAGSDGVGRDARSERMGRVDDGVDALACEKRGQAFGAAEAADASRDRRWSGVGGRSRQRQNCRNIGLIGDPPRKRACFRRAAENEQTKRRQGAAP